MQVGTPPSHFVASVRRIFCPTCQTVLCGNGFTRLSSRKFLCRFCGKVITDPSLTERPNALRTPRAFTIEKIEGQRRPGELYCRYCRMWVPQSLQVPCNGKKNSVIWGRFKHKDCLTMLTFGPRRKYRGGRDSRPIARRTWPCIEID